MWDVVEQGLTPLLFSYGILWNNLSFLLFFREDSKYLTSLEETEWLSQICELMQTATQAAVAMDCDKSSVLFSYGDGFDRTAQVNKCHVFSFH